MHYYKRNLGDYAKKAGRLTMLQHGAYTLLIDACYDREVFPTLDDAIEWTWASTQEEIDAVKFVLSRFFHLDSEGQYVQDRILQELLEYHSKADKNKQIAIERETKRRENGTKRTRIVHESPPNQEPRTKNQEPIKYSDEFESFWKAYDKPIGKINSFKIWKSLNLAGDVVEIVLKKAKHHSINTDRQFRKDPERWLKGKHWEDGGNLPAQSESPKFI